MKSWLKWTAAGLVLALLAAGAMRTLSARQTKQAALQAQQEAQKTPGGDQSCGRPTWCRSQLRRSARDLADLGHRQSGQHRLCQSHASPAKSKA
jgi:uncharacterized low-complexity protein